VSGHFRKRLSGSAAWSGAAGGHDRERMQRRAGVTKLGLSAERQIGRSRSAHMLCYNVINQSWFNRRLTKRNT